MGEHQPLESQRGEWKVGELPSKSDVLVRSSDGAGIQAQHQGLFGTQEMIRFIPPSPTSGGLGLWEMISGTKAQGHAVLTTGWQRTAPFHPCT